MSTPYRGIYRGPNAPLIEYRLFPQDYFSIFDISIYFGGVFIDEITSLQFSMQEQILPMYGYNDYRFRHVAHGNRLIQGMFSINFKEAYYIPAVLENINTNSKPFTHELWAQEDIEEIYQKYRNGEFGYMNRDTFETISDYYEAAIWGGPRKAIGPLNFEEILKRRQTSCFFNQEGFTITLSYGASHAAFAARNGDTYRQILGNQYKPDSDLLPIEKTVKNVVNVHLTGCTQSINLSGEPVQELYSFIAQDLDNFDDIIEKAEVQRYAPTTTSKSYNTRKDIGNSPY